MPRPGPLPILGPIMTEPAMLPAADAGRSAPTSLEASHADRAPFGMFHTAAPTFLTLLIAICIVTDLLSDIRGHRQLEHMIGMIIGTVLSSLCLALMWRLVRMSRAEARALEVALDASRADVLAWRTKAADTLQGLGSLIDGQFDAWELSPAEREVGILLLKGLSLKDIAAARETTERTARQQALAVYHKAGLAGRAELSAFFLEDLLLPPAGAADAAAGPGGRKRARPAA
jgi:DNA-binding CsgD family transcriptional regulator